MKKLLVIFLMLFTFTIKVNALELTENAKSSILVEASTGEVIYQKQQNERFAPASMTKIMSLILIMEEIEKGSLTFDEEITISKNASSMGGSQIYLEEGEKMSVEELLKGIAMASANDAVVALAERVAGSEEAFVFKMNQKAKKLNLKNTNFKNATGLDVANHYSSALDMSIMARELVRHDKILEFSSKYEDYLRQDSDKKFWLVNTNKLIKTYDGMDGLKTGYTKEAGYCLTSTAKKNNMRLIGVIMGEETSAQRNEEMRALLDFGFNQYKVNGLLPKNKSLGKYKNPKMKIENINIVSKNEINILNKKGNSKRKVKYTVKLDKDKKLPIKKGDVIGKVYIYEKGKKIYTGDVTVDKNIKKANLLNLSLKSFVEMLTGNLL